MNSTDSELSSSGWTATRITDSLTYDDVLLVLENKVGAIRVPNFVSASDSDRLVQAAKRVGFGSYPGVVPHIGRIGITQFECANDAAGKDTYFVQAQDANRVFKDITASMLNPVTAVQSSLCACGFDAQVAIEEGYGPYFTGLFRDVSNGAQLHYDYGPFDGAQPVPWAIANVQQQVSWNIYLSDVPDGECVVYHRPWTDELEASAARNGTTKSSYGIDECLVDSEEHVLIQPRKGELVLFNSQNLHKVLPAAGVRLSVSGFLGRTNLANSNIVMWS